MKRERVLWGMVAIFGIVAVWSAWHPHDWLTWGLETFPAFVGLAILAGTYRRFGFTTLVYALLLGHALLLFVGGHYTYAEVPLFNRLRDHFHQTRNDFDRVGHFAQGFVPAMVARELLLRLGIVTRRGWIAFLVVCICLAISATYELFEWRVAVATGEASDAFLGAQGDVWDTQEDMATAFVGAILALLLLSRLHDRALSSANMRPVLPSSTR